MAGIFTFASLFALAGFTWGQDSVAPSAPVGPPKGRLAKNVAVLATSADAKTGAATAEESSTGDEAASSSWIPANLDLTSVMQVVYRVWHFQLTTVGKDTPITVGTLITGLSLFILGYFAAKSIASWLEKRVFKRLGIPPTAAAPLQKIAFYTLVATFTFFTLNYLSVPLAAFTFLGGAFAIGVGFGSQNLMNNFISGLILLAEQPIRVGDVIQIDGFTGKVSEIGARSTRITTGSNTEIIVPNSTFLQTNVVNWTLSDDRICANIKVGVAYGSPARQVAELLRKAAVEQPGVLSKPAPNVAFTNFGEHALEFELSYCVHMGQTDRGKTESELRFRIDELFAEHGILVAYPQRDVHLNLLRPLEVRLQDPRGNLLSSLSARGEAA